MRKAEDLPVFVDVSLLHFEDEVLELPQSISLVNAIDLHLVSIVVQLLVRVVHCGAIGLSRNAC